MEEANKILLSVVVPIYNVDKYLDLCLDSLCKALRDVPSKQVICVNDGSTDNSLAIIKAYVDNYGFVECIDKANAGYGAAINAGMSAAKGEFFTIVESDDCIIPEVYGHLLEKLTLNPDADFIKTPYLVWVDGQVTKTVSLSDAPEYPFSAVEDPQGLMFPPSIWSAIYRRSFLDEQGIYVIETPGAGYQDTFFSTLLFLTGGKMLYHNEAYYLYRNDRMDASRHSRTKTTEIVHIFDEIKTFLEAKEIFSGKIEYLYYTVFFKRLVWFFSTVNPAFQIEIFKLAYHRFLPVFEDKVLYACVDMQLTVHEKKQLSDLKAGQFRSFHHLFNSPQVKPTRHSDFMFYKELDRYISSWTVVKLFKETFIYKVAKILLLEVGKLLKFVRVSTKEIFVFLQKAFSKRFVK